MRAVQFWFREFPEATALLAEHAPGAHRAWTGPDDYGYWREFAREWQDPRENLTVIEGDVGIHAEVIPQFSACGEPWCAFENEIGPGGWTPMGLGCTKFSASLRERVTVQDIMCPVPHAGAGGCKGAWCEDVHSGGSACHNRHHGCPDCGAFCFRHVDGPVTDAIRLVTGQAAPHVHAPRVTHFHDYGSG